MQAGQNISYPIQHVWVHQNIHHGHWSKSLRCPEELTFSFWIVGRRGILGGTGVVAGMSTESIGYLQTSMEVLQHFNKLS